MSSQGFVDLSVDFSDALGSIAGTENVFTNPAGVVMPSKNDNGYSPFLSVPLEWRRAPAAAEVMILEVLRDAVSRAVKSGISIPPAARQPALTSEKIKNTRSYPSPFRGRCPVFSSHE